MKYILLLTGLLLLTLATSANAVGGHPTIDLPDDVDIHVELHLKPTGTHTLIITNQSGSMFKAADPFQSRGVLSFAVADHYGNVVKPTGIAKADPANRTINLPVQKSSVFKFQSLRYLTGTALFEYQLTPGETYRVIAIYRPAGLKGPGFSSKEVMITFPNKKPLLDSAK
ncbi:MAG: hypothetical protein COA78_28585 [Blastopirellula sp.]|nr:MAG: hypothetical protein COA78_28585 [Blastopirellula sp.]